MSTSGAPWRDAVVEDGIRERRFDLKLGDEQIPGIVWTPANASEPLPVVLFGHGGSPGHKESASAFVIRDQLLSVRACAIVAIDQPLYGERATSETTESDRGRALLDPAAYSRIVAEWSAVLDFLLATGEFDPEAVAYVGFSLGCAAGMPFVAGDPRIRAAALGLAGTRFTPFEAAELEVPGVLLDAAGALECPVLWVVQWDDRLVPRDGCLELFDRVRSSTKRMYASPGDHGDIPLDAFRASARFVFDSLERGDTTATLATELVKD